MQHDQELATYEHVSAGTYRLVGAPSDPSVLNTGSFKKSKLTKKELKELLIDKLDNFDKDYLIKSLVKFLNHAQLLDLLDSIDREIF